MMHVDSKIHLGNCFKLLAVCFYEPDKELFIQERLCENLAGLLNISGHRDAGTAALAMIKSLMVSDAEELATEYASLFLGPFELIAPPYGSIYLEDKKMLMGDSTIAVQKMYQEAGLSLDVKEVPDHIALELEFMHYLYAEEAEAKSNGDNPRAQMLESKSKEFLSTYLASWTHQFCTKIRTSTSNSFYRNLADCLESFIKQEASDLTNVAVDRESNHACQPSA